LSPPTDRARPFHTLGLQRRIMLYVTVGLFAMFGGLALLGLGAIDQASELVFSERLATAHTTASILERDFEAIAIEAREEIEELEQRSAVAGGAIEGTAGLLLTHFSGREVSPFFRVSGVWKLDLAGKLTDASGSPSTPFPGRIGDDGAVLNLPSSTTAVLPALGPVAAATPLAAIMVRAASTASSRDTILIIHLVGVNSTAAYVPAAHGRPPADDPAGSAPESASDKYHLEVVDPDGIAVLGIGEDERPGEPSSHFPAIHDLMRDHGAAALLHQPGAADPFEPHVMAVAPISSTPFYLVLEQPVDVALALPSQLRERLLFWIVVGFVMTLAVAWVTTRHVVRPTELLTAAAGRMAQGDLTSPVGVTASDEIGELAESLDLMRQDLLVARAASDATNRALESRVADRTARLGEVLRKTISAQEEERYRLARELHDETAQTLAALSIMLDRARDSLDDRSSQASVHVREAKAVATRLLDETRRLILGLRPLVLDDLGLVPAVRWQCETTLGDRGLHATIDDRLGPTRIPSHVEVALFRIVQEAITNVARHADARHVDIKLMRDGDTVTVIVADDGKGFEVGLAMGTAGRYDTVGLSGMEERVGLIGGSMQIRSAPGAGTTIEVKTPLGGGAT
jgi:signal transduction histidine kinase